MEFQAREKLSLENYLLLPFTHRTIKASRYGIELIVHEASRTKENEMFLYSDPGIQHYFPTMEKTERKPCCSRELIIGIAMTSTT